jgi:hypothetical protein
VWNPRCLLRIWQIVSRHVARCLASTLADVNGNLSRYMRIPSERSENDLPDRWSPHVKDRYPWTDGSIASPAKVSKLIL